MSAYYNENDPKAAATLRELIAQGHIAPGEVDERSIEDVRPDELRGYRQVHLFAGFGLWSLAFRWAGIDDIDCVWSCSCPCQPFSAAGQGAGFADERHLWPAAFHLIQHAKRPDVPIYGEQVAGARVGAWLDLVWSDLEAIGHAFRPVVLASAGFGAPIIRQRTFWMARAECSRRHDGRRMHWGCLAADAGGEKAIGCELRSEAQGDGVAFGVARPDGRFSLDLNLQRSGQHGLQSQNRRALWSGDSGAQPNAPSDLGRSSPTNGFWQSPDWLRCRDDKWRPVEPGTFPLAVGYPERVGLLRGFGNAISPQVAAAFIAAHREAHYESCSC